MRGGGEGRAQLLKSCVWERWWKGWGGGGGGVCERGKGGRKERGGVRVSEGGRGVCERGKGGGRGDK